MGTTINLVIERRRVNADSIWSPLASFPALPEDYAIFTAIAGVRSEFPRGAVQIHKPKGLPLDPSWLTEQVHKKDRRDAHSHSHLSAEEFLDAFKENEWNARNDWGNYRWAPLLHLLAVLKKDRKHYTRVVFWFMS